ncbi:hypothetical protein RN001_000349 [Aquatica leii]|uniref:DDE Tnp4 domain-containing protein n=1 Tax=Aquatica leii TaxID=1421715 RepID=A0AAN7PF72_9COLE|nr:hypothetical protein RN001_000349 [Aquatica leii]
MDYASSSSSEWEEEVEVVASFLAVEDRNNSNRVWVHNINKKRENLGEFYRLVSELRRDPKRFHMYFRMTMERFDYLHQLIKNDIKKINTQFCRAITSVEKLAVCLRFLATGNSFRSIAFSCRLGFSTMREIVKDVCDVIWKRLGPIAMPPPTQETWKKTSTRFKEMWHFPNCIGGIHGKPIDIQCPINAGSNFYNYNGCHLVVLLAIVDADYNLIAIDIGAYGRNSDGGIFSTSEMGKRFQNATVNVPGSTPLIQNGEPQPYVLVGGKAFLLKTYMLRPYSRNALGENEPNKIFNYRLSRTRRVVENAFGPLDARLRCFRGHLLEVQPEFVDKLGILRAREKTELLRI